jgi:hypothetical protein
VVRNNKKIKWVERERERERERSTSTVKGPIDVSRVTSGAPPSASAVIFPHKMLREIEIMEFFSSHSVIQLLNWASLFGFGQ